MLRTASAITCPRGIVHTPTTPRAAACAPPLHSRRVAAIIRRASEPDRGARGDRDVAAGGDSELMSRPPKEQPQVFFSEETMSAPPRDLPDPAAAAEGSEGSKQESAARASPGGDQPEGGRFDEEAVEGSRPYDPRPRERGHGVPPHRDESNTGPGPTSQAQQQQEQQQQQQSQQQQQQQESMIESVAGGGGSAAGAAGGGSVIADQSGRHPEGDEQNPAAAI